MKRILGWFGSLKAQFAVLLVIALIIANVATFFVLGLARDREFLNFQRFANLERLTTIVPVINSLEPRLRQDLVQASSSRRFSIDINPRPVVKDDFMDADTVSIANFIKEQLDITSDGSVRVSILRRPPNNNTRELNSRGNRIRGQGVLVSIKLSDGMWLNSRQMNGPNRQPLPSGVLLLILFLTFITVLLVGLWFIHRLTKPLKALGEAANKAGRGDRAARLQEVGAREIRDTARAFNKMQVDINEFETERARTIAALGHDLRTPITSLRLRTEMVDDASLREPMIETLDNMQVMAQELLSWGQVEAVQEELKTLDISKMLKEICEGTSVKFIYTGSVELTGRPVALQRAFSNLVSNVERYADKGNAKIEHSDENITIVIEDNGPGIPDNEIETMFKPFERGEKSRSNETGGHGLGLSIVKSIVRSHGGEISLQNKSDKTGLIATVILPQ